jgi:hypothetical protein
MSRRRRCRYTFSRRPPSPGYIWAPGYWGWDDEVGYYWVPGTWVSPPREGLLWTPGYWGWTDGVYSFRAGYWGPTVGFYGGVAYGFGYTGVGFEGAYWQNGALFYNRSVSNFGNVSITNVYNKTVVNNVTNVSYNGGTGGTTATPTPAQLAAANAHVDPAYPKDLLPKSGLQVEPDAPLQPGETRTVKFVAADVAWEAERLTSLMRDPDSSFGGLLYFYDSDGERHIANVYGTIVPTFVH